MEGLGGHGRLVGQWVWGLCSMQGAHGCMCVQRGGGGGGQVYTHVHVLGSERGVHAHLLVRVSVASC